MILVFTDLDGTLLDHESYSYQPALPALGALKARSIPIILASSKTEAEMRALADALELDTPIIVENGAGVVGMDDVGPSTPIYDDIRAFLDALPPQIRKGYSGFGDWGASEIAERTGLSIEAARGAAKRQFSEPGLWTGTEADLTVFRALLAERGLQAVRGGRFLTIMPLTSKADAMMRICAHFEKRSGEPIFSVAFGDAPNDIAMLETANQGMVIANPAHDALPLLNGEREGGIWRSALPGPAGWNELATRLLKDLDPR